MRKLIIVIVFVIGTIFQIRATTFTVSVNDGGWAGPAAGNLAKAISDFNAAGGGSHIIDIQVNVSQTNPANWTINNAAAVLTINGNGHTVDGPGYNPWSITVSKLIINSWTMTAGFNTTPVVVAGAGGHTFTNTNIANVSFSFTSANGVAITNSTFSVGTHIFGGSSNVISNSTLSGGTYTFNGASNSLTNSTFDGTGATNYMRFNSGSNGNTISGCTIANLQVQFTGSSTNQILSSRFTLSPVSFATASNNSTVYGCKFNTNTAGTALVASGVAFDISVNASTGNIIGGNTVTKRNLFALSSTNSITVTAASANTKIIGNYFGTDITGINSLSGAGTNSTISINASQNVIIDSNVVSSMKGTTGGAIEVVAGNCNGMKIRYNKIGVDALGAGGTSFANANHGIIFTAGTVNNLDIIGNTVSRSTNIGISIGAGANPLNIQDNFIGSNSTGLYDGTDYGNGHGGIAFTAGTLSNITITGNVLVRNGWVTQDNFSCGIYVPTAISTISITNNKIGVYADDAISGPGTNYSGNAFAGIYFNSTSSAITISNNTIGRNGFGSTKSHGISTAGTITNLTISNNYIGITAASVAIGNANSGLDLQNVTTGSITGNYIGDNEGRRTDIPAAGIALSNGSNQISITGNFIGVAPNATNAGQKLNGSYDGSAIRVEGTANKITIDNNDLAYSAGNGVNVIAGADYTLIFDNSIYCNAAKGINLNCGGSAPNGPGNNSFGCGTITLNVFAPLPTAVSGGRPTNSVVYVYNTGYCAAGACGTNPQGQDLFTAASSTYPTGSTWAYNNGTTMYNDITALAVGTGANCSGTYCRTSEFTNCVDNTLPVSLLSFTAEALPNKTVQLNWSTASEVSNAYFIVERSKDGKTFEPIGKIDGNGNSSSMINYEFTDETPYSGISYYRLKQVDMNGSMAASDVKTVSFNSDDLISLYPNPNNGQFTLVAYQPGTYEISITDVLGQVVYHSSISSESILEKNIQTFLAKGTYIVHVNSNELTFVKKIIVE
jgi:hypothetical protein